MSVVVDVSWSRMVVPAHIVHSILFLPVVLGLSCPPYIVKRIFSASIIFLQFQAPTCQAGLNPTSASLSYPLSRVYQLDARKVVK